MLYRNKLYWVDVGWMDRCWMDVGWLEKVEIKLTQPSWSWSWAELVNISSGFGKEMSTIFVKTRSYEKFTELYLQYTFLNELFVRLS